MIDYDVEDALYYGALHYNEGMGYTDAADHEKRIACFQAAEVLYRSTAEKGSADAYLCLGYVYSYDRCEGRYWRDPMVFAVDDCGGVEVFHFARKMRLEKTCIEGGDQVDTVLTCH